MDSRTSTTFVSVLAPSQSLIVFGKNGLACNLFGAKHTMALTGGPPMKSPELFDALKYGALGFGFLLALLTYLLLRKEQHLPRPRPSMLKAINRFMAFSLILAFVGFISEGIIKVYPELLGARRTELSDSQRSELRALIDESHTVARGDIKGCKEFLSKAAQFLKSVGNHGWKAVEVGSTRDDPNSLGNSVNKASALLENEAQR